MKQNRNVSKDTNTKRLRKTNGVLTNAATSKNCQVSNEAKFTKGQYYCLNNIRQTMFKSPLNKQKQFNSIYLLSGFTFKYILLRLDGVTSEKRM